MEKTVKKPSKDLTMFITGLVIVLVTFGINMLPILYYQNHMMDIFLLMLDNEMLYAGAVVIMLVPIGVILSAIAGNKATGIITFALTGGVYVYQSKLPALFIGFALVLICSLLYDWNKGKKIIRAIISVLLGTGVIIAIGVYADSFDMFKYNYWMYIIWTLGITGACFAVSAALECIPLLKRFDEKSRDLDKNFRVHSINRKLMIIINIICFVLIVLFSIMSVLLLNQKEKERQRAEQSVWAIVIYNAIAEDADIYADHDMDKIQAEAEVIKEAFGIGHIELPAYVAITTNRDGHFYRNVYEVTKSSEILSDYAYDVAWTEEFEIEPKEGMLLPQVEGNSDLAIFENSLIKQATKDALFRILAVALILMSLVNILAEMFIRKNIVRPINQMTTEALEFAFGQTNGNTSGEGGSEIKTRIEIRSGDEIESLSRAFHKTMDDMELYIESVREKSEQVADMQHNIIVTMADIIESRDLNTGGHIKRTAIYVGIIARRLMEQGLFPDTLTKDYMDDMIVAAPLHDMGKIHVPDEILNKNGRLTDEEFAIMKSHASVGKELLDVASESLGEFRYLFIAKQMAESHHEWWNGNGYPQKIAGEEIPLCARIMAVADVFDALVSKRCYKEPMDLDVAFDIIKKETGTHFDPVVGQIFIDSRAEIEETLRELSEA